MTMPPIIIALFRSVPNWTRYRARVETRLRARFPTATFTFVEFDCYRERRPPANVDIFAYDNIFLRGYIRENLVRPLQVKDIHTLDDFYPFALNACTFQNTFYGIPYLACQHGLFYKRNDVELQQAVGLPGITQVLGPCLDPNAIWPGQGMGLLSTFSRRRTTALLYLKAANALHSTFPLYPHLPARGSDLLPVVLTCLKQFTHMAGKAQVNFVDPDQQRLLRFLSGTGRAFHAVTELASFFPERVVNSYGFRLCPYGNEQVIQPFVDSLSINPLIVDPARLQLVIDVANEIASAQMMITCLDIDAETPTRQYLISTRPSVMRQLALVDPLYADIFGILQRAEVALLLDENGPDWLEGDIPEIIRRGAAGDQALEELIKFVTLAMDPSLPANLLERWG